MKENEGERDTGAERNDCPVCEKSFARRDAMKRHLLGIHGPEYVEPDPRARVRLRARVDQAILKGKKLLKNPVEITAPEVGKVRIRSIRPGAPSKVDDEEEEIEAEGEDSEVPDAKVRGPREGPAAVPTAVPARKDRPRKMKGRAKAKAEPEYVDEESIAEPKEGPSYPTFEPGDLVRFDGTDYRVREDGRLEWVVYPSKPGPRLEEGDRFFAGDRLYEIRRHTYHNLGILPYLKADEVREDAEDAEELAEEEKGDGDEEDHDKPGKGGLLGLGLGAL